MRGSEVRRLREAAAAAALEDGDVAMDVDLEVEHGDVRIAKRKTQVFGGEQRKMKVRVNEDMDMDMDTA